ncbi:hypothetical protein M0R45_013270 [Rubus argutus]|uniref:ACT domain-containing protein n=1 Tax=Rubus argutus TaxID=59490 RepID=A0AAW1XIN1_RUBAR
MSTLSSRFLTINDRSNLTFSSSPPPLRSLSRPSSIFYAPHNVSKPIRASESQAPSATPSTSSVTVENSESDSDSEPSGGTLFVIRARNRIGLLGTITRVFNVLGLRVDMATVEFEGDYFIKRFFVTDSHGAKIEDRESLDRIQKALLDAIDDCGGSVSAGPTTTRGGRGPQAGFGPGLRRTRC